MRIFARRIMRFSTAKEPCGTAFQWSDSKIKKIQIPEKVKRVSLGQNHTAVVGQSGNLYTYGSNKYGQLGHGNTNECKTPKIVDYFEIKGIKVKEALCGDNHTTILSEDGNVYTCGWGGSQSFSIFRLFGSKMSPLGHGNLADVHKPKKVKYFENIHVDRISVGRKFNIVIDDAGKIYFWGCGEYGVAGDGSTKNCMEPKTNQYFEYLEDESKIAIKKVKSCSTYSMALMTDNLLYGWGSNHAGQIGIKNEIGIELHEMVNYPQPVIREGYEKQLVTNFDISQNVTIFQLDNNELWWCGRHLIYKPEKITFEEQNNVKLFAAGSKSIAIVTNSNAIYELGKFVSASGEESLTTGVTKLDGSKIFGGQIVGIGGEYNSRYAIIN